jgi:pimeloyl-ACP methyl ester carboxylesterase
MDDQPSAFKSPQGEAEYLAAYAASLALWTVPYEEIDAPGRFGCTHLIASGPKDAPALVLLHGYMASSTMWAPNMAALSRDYRVYAVDLMGQPGKTVSTQPITSRADFAAWLTGLFDTLAIDKAFLVGMSHGGWVALNYALAAPERVHKLALLSPAACFLPLVTQFYLRVMPILVLPRRFLVASFMGWLTYTDNLRNPHTREIYERMLDQMTLGFRHYSMRQDRAVAPAVYTDAELTGLRVPTLLLIGEQEAIYNPPAALARARRLIPAFEGELVPSANHDMSFSQPEIVNARLLRFFQRAFAGEPGAAVEESRMAAG